MVLNRGLPIAIPLVLGHRFSWASVIPQFAGLSLPLRRPSATHLHDRAGFGGRPDQFERMTDDVSLRTWFTRRTRGVA